MSGRGLGRRVCSRSIDNDLDCLNIHNEDHAWWMSQSSSVYKINILSTANVRIVLGYVGYLNIHIHNRLHSQLSIDPFAQPDEIR